MEFAACFQRDGLPVVVATVGTLRRVYIIVGKMEK